jgi:hypothetical protein
MELLKVSALLIMSVVSCAYVIRFFNKNKMRAVSVLFGALFAVSFIYASMYIVSDVLRQNLGGVYYADTKFEAFILTQVDWLTASLAAFKTLTVGSVITSLLVTVVVSVIAALAAYRVYRIVKENGKHRDAVHTKKIIFENGDGVFLADRKNTYLKLGRLLN